MEHHNEFLNYSLPWLSYTNVSEYLEKYVNDDNCKLYKKGDVLSYQGDSSDRIYFITKGMVKISTLNSEGEEKVIWYSIAPSLQGIAPFFNNTATTNASIIAYTDCICSVFEKDEFEIILEQEKGLCISLIRNLSGKIQKLFAQIEGLSFYSTQLVVCRFLYHFAYEHQKNTDYTQSNTLSFNLPFTQTEISAITSVHRVTVTKVFNSLKKEGIINFDTKGNITIHNMDILKSKCL